MQDSRYYSIELASTIAGISRRRAADWARDGVFVPSRIYATDHRPYTHLYSFDDLVALRVISILRNDYGLPLKTASAVGRQLQQRTDTPWDAMQIWLVGKTIHVSKPDTDSAVRIDLEPIVETVRQEADKLWQRDPADYGKVERRRNVMGGALVVKGTRIPASTIVNMSAFGASVEEILRAYPTLVPEDVHGVLELMGDQRRVA